jgi:hypothetical protein
MFNHQARWDRDLPGDSPVDAQAIEVFARFKKGRVIPLYFISAGGRFDIARINFCWSERKGKNLLYFFSVSDKSDTYQLCLDAENMSWRLISS